MSDAARFEVFVRSYQDMVFAVAVRLLANAAEAEDVSQTVFLKAFEHFRELDGNPNAGGWLKKVATNDCLNHLSRYRARWRFFSELGPAEADTSSAADALDRLASHASSSQAELERAEMQARLEEAVRRLPDHQRVPLVLFHFEEKSYQEIAGLTGVTLAKVKTDIHRGREALKRALAGNHESA
jgi:RNA polymerase sigma-70 factor (ECF subfamily)